MQVWACTLACRMDDESLHYLLALSKGLLESLPLPLLVQVRSLFALLVQKLRFLLALSKGLLESLPLLAQVRSLLALLVQKLRFLLALSKGLLESLPLPLLVQVRNLLAKVRI
jgi:hypothetical protein